MSTQPDVVFVVLDSLRTDRTSLYGHGRETTPALDRLAERATVYDHAVTPASWTLPSHCSMFTGLFPSEHGVTNGFTDAGVGLPESTRTLTERLAERDYRTAGFSNNPWVGSLSGLDRGFDEYVEWNLEITATDGASIHGRADRLYDRTHRLLGHAARQPLFLLKRPFFTDSLVRRADRWLRTDGWRPRFTFLNLMEAHSPYFPPRSAFRALDLDPPGVVEPRLLNTRLLGYTMGRTSLGGDRRERTLEYYDAAVRYQDGKVERLLETLHETGRFDDALVVVCADHGKTLGEFDRDTTPPHYLRDVNTNVPLLVKYPGQTAGERVADPVELTRLFDVVSHGGERRLESLSPGTALTEEFIPHTGRAEADVTRWRALSRRGSKLLRSDSGDRFLVDREGPRGPAGAGRRHTVQAVGTADESRTEEAAELEGTLDDRVDAFASPVQRDAADSEELSGDLESQLRDLGYLD